MSLVAFGCIHFAPLLQNIITSTHANSPVDCLNLTMIGCYHFPGVAESRSQAPETSINGPCLTTTWACRMGDNPSWAARLSEVVSFHTGSVCVLGRGLRGSFGFCRFDRSLIFPTSASGTESGMLQSAQRERGQDSKNNGGRLAEKSFKWNHSMIISPEMFVDQHIPHQNEHIHTSHFSPTQPPHKKKKKKKKN